MSQRRFNFMFNPFGTIGDLLAQVYAFEFILETQAGELITVRTFASTRQGSSDALYYASEELDAGRVVERTGSYRELSREDREAVSLGCDYRVVECVNPNFIDEEEIESC
jgi:hypothetical protein